MPKLGLKTTIGGRTLRDIAADCLALARAGLKRRNRLDRDGRDEARHLEPLEHIVASGQTPAELLLAKYKRTMGRLGGAGLSRKSVLNQRSARPAPKTCG